MQPLGPFPSLDPMPSTNIHHNWCRPIHGETTSQAAMILDHWGSQYNSWPKESKRYGCGDMTQVTKNITKGNCDAIRESQQCPYWSGQWSRILLPSVTFSSARPTSHPCNTFQPPVLHDMTAATIIDGRGSQRGTTGHPNNQSSHGLSHGHRARRFMATIRGCPCRHGGTP